MIHAVLVFNTSGVPRLTKFYSPIHQSQQTLVEKIYALAAARPAGLCNFLDAPELEAFLKLPKGGDGEKLRVVYRSYATLYFVFVVDSAESELGILDLIQVFVESLDSAFENVCELDLVFHFDEAHHILTEIIQGGLVLETNVHEIDRAGESSAPRLRRTIQLNQGKNRSHLPILWLLAVGSRGAGLQTPLGWLAGRLTGVGGR
ncbi:Adaptor protein complex sigma subunit [Ganoderma leucocontextum]|nr:Adaptor protein complex sigma subunit [Ganoderma leucocontextum]